MGRGESGRSWVTVLGLSPKRCFWTVHFHPDSNVNTHYMRTAYGMLNKTAANFTFISGNIDVVDGCWGRNLLVTNFACWLQINIEIRSTSRFRFAVPFSF